MMQGHGLGGSATVRFSASVPSGRAVVCPTAVREQSSDPWRKLFPHSDAVINCPAGQPAPLTRIRSPGRATAGLADPERATGPGAAWGACVTCGGAATPPSVGWVACGAPGAAAPGAAPAGAVAAGAAGGGASALCEQPARRRPTTAIAATPGPSFTARPLVRLREHQEPPRHPHRSAATTRWQRRGRAAPPRAP